MPEESIFSYQTTKYRLIPPLAEHLGYRFVIYDLTQRWEKMQNSLDNPKNEYSIETHALLSCLKSIGTNRAQYFIQSLREIMGGHGYSQYSLIGMYRNHNDMNCTM
jgi:acyl-CoA oxidase